MKPTLLLVEDEESIRSQMKWALTGEYEVLLAEDRTSTLELFRARKPHVVLLDLGLPPHPGTPDEGMAILATILALDPLTKIIIVSGQGERDNSLRAVGLGAYDFLIKPIQLDELAIILKRAFHIAGLEREFRSLQRQAGSNGFEGMLGSSSPMQQVFSSIRKVATTDAPVLILGESGTGKERAAHAVHRLSNRKDGPFIAINCGAIPENLLESELFGHEKGSFTGAHATRLGRIETAEGGTLFLDEIGELPLALQVKLLRFLQEGQIDRVGGRKEIQVNARVIAATNADLPKSMAAGSFREDLYYRLAVITIKLPPLRERESDVRLLAQAFLDRFALQHHKEGLTYDPDALQAIERHNWPGNVRELENRVQRAIIMSDRRRISPGDLELASSAPGTGSLNLKEAREAVERELITTALRKHNGKISAAATELGVSRPTLYELMERLGIQRDGAS